MTLNTLYLVSNMKMTICIIRTTGRPLLERAYDWAKKFDWAVKVLKFVRSGNRVP